MSVLMITYDLHRPDEINSYQALYQYLQQFPHCHSLESVWFIDTILSCATIREGIKASLPFPTRDQFIVIKQQKIWTSWRTPDLAKWLKAPDRNWS